MYCDLCFSDLQASWDNSKEGLQTNVFPEAKLAKAIRIKVMSATRETKFQTEILVKNEGKFIPLLQISYSINKSKILSPKSNVTYVMPYFLFSTPQYPCPPSYVH